MTTTKTTKTNKKPKLKTKPRMALNQFIPNHRDFQKEVARLEEMLGTNADPEATLDLPAGMSREWAEEAWPVVKANAERQFRPLKPGTEFPSGIYADRAWLATLLIMESPFNPRLRTLAIRQVLGVDEMREKATKRLARAARRAEASQN
ncbi:hypothetical protein SAMN02799622_00790 [Methylobacterium sp. UNC378MF]|uniref:hypothetical protein n=1 Tax=Methylobacterium sp. UNC378MF TaxID=1502748 RepID=UPI000884C228|nr:hypothetical protein [Methylobacterium sp. UNC378MF]SDA12723.1 hypothetical protein SAMN02799622_00790 [Methylobacterium sp. UNC378MF]